DHGRGGAGADPGRPGGRGLRGGKLPPGPGPLRRRGGDDPRAYGRAARPDPVPERGGAGPVRLPDRALPSRSRARPALGKPVITVQVGSQVSGQIAELRADFNSVVKKDQIIARIDPAIFEAKVNQAQADLDSAHATVINQQAQVERARADVENARAALAEAKA